MIHVLRVVTMTFSTILLLLLTKCIDIATNVEVTGHEILEKNLYSFEELEKVDQGMAPKGIEDVVEVVGTATEAWSVKEFMSQ